MGINWAFYMDSEAYDFFLDYAREHFPVKYDDYYDDYYRDPGDEDDYEDGEYEDDGYDDAE